MTERIKKITQKVNKEITNEIIKRYYEELGRNTAEINARKGQKYWRELARKGGASTAEKWDRIHVVADFNGFELQVVAGWPKERLDSEYWRIVESKETI